MKIQRIFFFNNMRRVEAKKGSITSGEGAEPENRDKSGEREKNPAKKDKSGIFFTDKAGEGMANPGRNLFFFIFFK